jgi:hypothetical protein
MRTQITCDELTDGYDTFKIITFRPPLEALKSEMKALFTKLKVPTPHIKWIQYNESTINAYYRFKIEGESQAKRINKSFKITYI